ncbi:metal-dependent transcriptional regulator [Ruminococcaceae bacterium OttesenSCG-928-N02]|nr:metal-dependent transcriptional regulator [Ruminococcaceae bacterium OttesenSCG-928-N02]
MEIRKSAEDYLESILILSLRNGKVRSIDVANELGFSKPSVSYAMKRFRENGLVNMDDSGYLALTASGMLVAQRVYERHMVLIDLLLAIGVTAETAKEDACKLEHELSEETFARLQEYYNKNFEKK